MGGISGAFRYVRREGGKSIRELAASSEPVLTPVARAAQYGYSHGPAIQRRVARNFAKNATNVVHRTGRATHFRDPAPPGPITAALSAKRKR